MRMAEPVVACVPDVQTGRRGHNRLFLHRPEPWRRDVVGILLTVGCLLVAQEGSPTSADRPAEVRRLLRQLDAPRLEQRNAAETALIDLGPEVLPLLPKSEDRLSAEVRQRLGRVRQKLEQKLAAAAVEPSLVTLANKQIKLSQLLKEIQLQTGNRIIDSRRRFGQELSDPELAVDFDKTPFWKAMGVVMQQAGLTVYPFGSEKALYLVERSEETAPLTADGCQTGPVSVRADGFDRAPTVDRRRRGNAAPVHAGRLGTPIDPHWADAGSDGGPGDR